VIGDKRYESGLKTLPACCRDIIDRYFKHHEPLPRDNKPLIELFCGEQKFKPSPHIADIVRVHVFLGRHVPDYAWGSPELVAKWEARRKIAQIAVVGAGIAIGAAAIGHHVLYAHEHVYHAHHDAELAVMDC